ncbi:MAG: pro-sigmaK processing inhibitor BofA family protein [Eubacteriales bacterium]|nr:pro-sigmaK processing inhibitor BofA family protein [Eubacteriales bacterium]
MTNILTVVFIGLCVFAFIKILSAPIKGILKFILNMITGFLLLLAAEFICGFFDFSVGISYLNCLVAGVLGIPGVILLILLKILF